MGEDCAHGVDGGTFSVQLASVGLEKNALRDRFIRPRVETREGGLDRGIVDWYGGGEKTRGRERWGMGFSR